ncbi:MAG: hypothetical protein WBG54_06745 [Acidobacteriaceae bacterium]
MKIPIQHEIRRTAMPAYTCPYCKQHFFDVKVYHHEPEQVTCPHCKHTFPTDPLKARMPEDQ